MMNFEEWLLKKQKMGMSWFITMIDDKKVYYDKYDQYKCRVADFKAETLRQEIAETAHLLASL